MHSLFLQYPSRTLVHHCKFYFPCVHIHVGTQGAAAREVHASYLSQRFRAALELLTPSSAQATGEKWLKWLLRATAISESPGLFVMVNRPLIMTIAKWTFVLCLFFVTMEGRILVASLVLHLKSAYKSPSLFRNTSFCVYQLTTYFLSSQGLLETQYGPTCWVCHLIFFF